MQVIDIIFSDAEDIKKMITAVVLLVGLLGTVGKKLIHEVPLYLSSSIEVALMSERERWKYSCMNIIGLASGIWIMNLTISWISQTEKIKAIFMFMVSLFMAGLFILLLVVAGKWLYRKIKECHIGRFGAALIKALYDKVTKKYQEKKQRKEKIKRRNGRLKQWIKEKWTETAGVKKDTAFNFYKWFIYGTLLIDLTASGAITYEGIGQRLGVSTLLTVFTIQTFVCIISIKRQGKKASIVFFSPENHKNIYIYLKNDQGNYICGNNRIMEECTEYYVIPQEQILDKKLKMADK